MAILYLILAIFMVFLMYQFAMFKPFKGNSYWVYGCGLAAGWFVRYATKK